MEEYYYTNLINEAEDAKDYNKATWLTFKGAMHNDSSSMDWLATKYSEGRGVSKNIEKSINWQVKAINKTKINKRGMFFYNLAITYRFKGDLQAYKYFLEKAQALGEDDATLDLAILYYGISKKEKQRVIGLLTTVINNNNICEAHYEEAQTFLNKLTTHRKINIFEGCLKKITLKEKARYNLLEINQDDLEDKFIEAVINYETYHYKKACKQFTELATKYHYSDAMNYLGDIYFNGEGVQQSYDKAAKWYHWSEELENTQGTLKLANLYKDIRQMSLYKYYLERAQQKGSDKATLLLAKLYQLSDKETTKMRTLLKKIVKSKTATVDTIYEAECLLKTSK